MIHSKTQNATKQLSTLLFSTEQFKVIKLNTEKWTNAEIQKDKLVSGHMEANLIFAHKDCILLMLSLT